MSDNLNSEFVSSEQWDGFYNLPVKSQQDLRAVFQELKDIGKNSLCILMLGKTGTGKSSTINSLLNEKGASQVGALTRDSTTNVVAFNRKIDDFNLTLVDTPGLIDKDMVSEKSFRKIKAYLSGEGNAVDRVMFFERIDMYRVEPIDRRVMESITAHFGKRLWQRTILVFTRAGMSCLPDGYAPRPFASGEIFKAFDVEREDMVKDALFKAGGPPDMPVAYVENLYPKNGQFFGCMSLTEEMLPRGVLPNETPWLPQLMRSVVKPLKTNFEITAYDFHQNETSLNWNHRSKWMIPFALVAQCAIGVFSWRLLIENITKTDYDDPYDPVTGMGLKSQDPSHVVEVFVNNS